MLNYNPASTEELRNWTFSETEFDPLALGKCEAVMSLGNGYMGLRSATEEPYIGEKEICSSTARSTSSMSSK